MGFCKIAPTNYQYQPCNTGVYPLFICVLDQGDDCQSGAPHLIQLPVTYRTESDYPGYATHTLSGRCPGSNL